MMSQHRELSRHAPAVGAMFLSALLFACMFLCARACSLPAFVGRPLPSGQVTLARWVIALAVLIPMHGRRGIDLIGNDKRGLLFRGISGGLAVYFLFLALSLTSVTHAVILNYTSLVFGPLFAYLFMHEKLTRRSAQALPIALVGILFITRPTSGSFQPGDFYALLSGILAGAAISEVRRLRKTESAWSIFFYLSIIGGLMALPGVLAGGWVYPTIRGWIILSVMGLAGVGAQLFMTYGYKYVRTAEGGLLMLSQIVYSSLAGVWLFGEALKLNTLAGGALVLCAALWLIVPAGKVLGDKEPDIADIIVD